MKFLRASLTLGIFLFFSFTAQATLPDWSENSTSPVGENPYQLDRTLFPLFRDAGKIHAQIYPVAVTGMLPPYEPIRHLIEDSSTNPLREFLNSLVRGASGYHSMDDVLTHLGLHEYPQASDQGIYSVPYPQGIRPQYKMGFGFIESSQGKGFSFSCAACHSANLFGKTVLGMTNRFPRANEFFMEAKNGSQFIQADLFKAYAHATEGETQMIRQLKESMKSVAVKKPLTLGLDTSLAQVSLSLNYRNQDAYASFSDFYAANPRPDILDFSPADSKPSVWWNLKYKNRWLSDGSVVSGNPILTNFLWNEIGRGGDLVKLESWLQQNEKILQEITTAVFSSEAPRFTDFFPAEKIDLEKAKAGEEVFNKTCSGCHGHYDKAWNLPNGDQLPLVEKLKTTAVRYPHQTQVKNVGTDPYRYRGMQSLEKLNALAISKKNGILIRAQQGYVPPPLVGIWARWPYLHNNSIPSLCALLSPQKDRPLFYYSGEAQVPATDFDATCNGYPLGANTPKAWQDAKHLYDTRRSGMSNQGHDEGIFLENGRELLSPVQKSALIQFLQTL
ncbi:MAG: c-type cytochrome [Pseudobdellovibrionaceae bacterium]